MPQFVWDRWYRGINGDCTAALMHLDFVNGIIEINSGMGKARKIHTG